MKILTGEIISGKLSKQIDRKANAKIQNIIDNSNIVPCI